MVAAEGIAAKPFLIRTLVNNLLINLEVAYPGLRWLEGAWEL